MNNTMNACVNIVELNNIALNFLLQGNNDGSVSTLGTALANLQIYQDYETAQQQQHQQQQACFGSLNHQQNLPQFQQQPPLPQLQAQQPSQGLSLTAAANCNQNNENLLLKSLSNTSETGRMCSVPLAGCASQVVDVSATDSTGNFSVFQQALTFSNPCLLNGSKIVANYNCFLSMILYNMGLSVHREALRNGKSADLQGALDLYEMSFSVIENAWQEFDVNDIMLLLMALFNNMGHIHSTFFNARQVQICVDWLQTLAGHPAFLKLMQREQYVPFFLNLLVVLRQSGCCCSPAA